MVRNLLLFLVIAGLTTFCLGLILPPVAVRGLDLKLATYAERKDECDLLFLGTSQTYHGIDPSLFDARAKEHGLATQSFNLGVDGAGLAEHYRHLRRVAELEPQGLRWILVEAERILRVGDEEQDAFLTNQLIEMTDMGTAALLWPYFGQVEPRTGRLARARWRTLVALVYHLTGVSRGTRWIERSLGMGATEDDRLQCIGPLGDGYTNLEDGERVSIQERPARYALKRRHMARRTLALLDREGHVAPATPHALPFYARIEQLGRSMGAQVVFFTIRRGVNSSDARALADAGAIESLLHFDDPPSYPELYDVDMTFDGGHLNRAGAHSFTLYMADAFAALVNSQDQ